MKNYYELKNYQVQLLNLKDQVLLDNPELKKDLQEVTNKLKNKSNPIRAIQTPFWNWICPTCRKGIGLEYECSKCGQKILWGNK